MAGPFKQMTMLGQGAAGGAGGGLDHNALAQWAADMMSGSGTPASSQPSQMIQTPSMSMSQNMGPMIQTPTAQLQQASGGGNWLREDWICPNCEDLQFARNPQCRKCGTPNPNPPTENPNLATRIPDALSGYIGPDGRLKRGFKPKKVCQFFLEGRCLKGAMCTYAHSEDDLKEGCGPEAWITNKQRDQQADWTCPACGDLQFARNAQCRKCGTPNPNDIPQNVNQMGLMPGMPGMEGVMPIPSMAVDNSNPDNKLCAVHFKKRSVRNLMEDGLGGYRCQPGFECQTGGPGGNKGGGRPAGPPPELSPGDWLCPGCQDHQFARNIQCRRCAHPRPEGFGPVPKGDKGMGKASPY